jgi:hypothetical protein
MQKQEIQETLPLWAIDVARQAGFKPSEVGLVKLTPKTVTFAVEGATQTLYRRNAWKR